MVQGWGLTMKFRIFNYGGGANNFFAFPSLKNTVQTSTHIAPWINNLKIPNWIKYRIFANPHWLLAKQCFWHHYFCIMSASVPNATVLLNSIDNSDFFGYPQSHIHVLSLFWYNHTFDDNKMSCAKTKILICLYCVLRTVFLCHQDNVLKLSWLLFILVYTFLLSSGRNFEIYHDKV